MRDNDIQKMSNRTADILMPTATVEMDTGYLMGFMRKLGHALDNADADTMRDWAWNAIQTFPPVPTKEEVAQQFPSFTLPMPEWA